MIWIDRLALVWGAVIVVGVVTLSLCTLSPPEPAIDLARTTVEVLLIVALPPWLLLRSLRWVVRGAWR